MLYIFATGGYNFEEVKPQFINGETLYEREQSAVLIANILTSGSGKKYTPICDNVFGAGKTSFIYKFRTILGDDNFPGKGPSYEELKSAVYLHIPFRPFGHHGPTYAECLDKALRIVRNVLAISCRCKEEDLCVDSLSSFTVSLAGICPLGSRRLLLHFDDVGSYEPMGNTLGGLMLHAMWRIGDKLRDQQHYFVMTGRSALLHLIGTERLLIEQQVTPDTGMVIPLPPLSVNAVRKMMVEYGVEGILDQAELIHSLTAGIPRAVYTVVHYFKANPTAKLLKESMDAVMAALNAACPQTLWSNDGDRLLFQRCVELAWAGVKFTNDSHMAGEAVTSFIARLGLFRQPVDGNADKFELLVPQQQR